jgi:hypothetical protein
MSATIIEFKRRPAVMKTRTMDYAELAGREGWFPLTICRTDWRKWDWVALMIDVPIEEFEKSLRVAREVWVRIPGKHRDYDRAWAALEDMMSTRH